MNSLCQKHHTSLMRLTDELAGDVIPAINPPASIIPQGGTQLLYTCTVRHVHVIEILYVFSPCKSGELHIQGDHVHSRNSRIEVLRESCNSQFSSA